MFSKLLGKWFVYRLNKEMNHQEKLLPYRLERRIDLIDNLDNIYGVII
jgi:hypothetical protein